MNNVDNLHKCRGLFGAIFGHSFNARYNVERTFANVDNNLILEAMDRAPMDEFTSTIIESIRKQSFKETYLGEVCCRCGKTVLI